MKNSALISVVRAHAKAVFADFCNRSPHFARLVCGVDSVSPGGGEVRGILETIQQASYALVLRKSMLVLMMLHALHNRDCNMTVSHNLSGEKDWSAFDGVSGRLVSVGENPLQYCYTPYLGRLVSIMSIKHG